MFGIDNVNFYCIRSKLKFIYNVKKLRWIVWIIVNICVGIVSWLIISVIIY